MSDKEETIEVDEEQKHAKELEAKVKAGVEEELKKPGTWLMVKTKEGDVLTGRVDSGTAASMKASPDSLTGMVLALECPVRYVDINFPVPGPQGDPIIHTTTAVRPELDVDDNPVYIPMSNIGRFKKVDEAKSAEEFVRLRHNAEYQELLRKKLEKDSKEMMERMSHAGLAMPTGAIDPRNIPPHVLAALKRQGRIR